MSIQPLPDTGEFAEFAESLRTRRTRTEVVVRQALRQAAVRYPDGTPSELIDVSHEVDGALSTLDTAAEELRVQNEALFAARFELEGKSALFHDLFELAPTAYIVTDATTRILYANDAACTLIRIPKNALVRKLLVSFVTLDERMAFRTGVLRTYESNAVCTWLVTVSPRGSTRPIDCRLRVRTGSIFGEETPRTLYWNITEETDEDLF